MISSRGRSLLVVEDMEFLLRKNYLAWRIEGYLYRSPDGIKFILCDNCPKRMGMGMLLIQHNSDTHAHINREVISNIYLLIQ